jgi:hypothetical protein
MEFKLKVDLQTLDKEVPLLMRSAIAANKCFGLSSKKTCYIYNPATLTAYFINSKGIVEEQRQYPNMEEFITYAAIQLASHRIFLSEIMLLEMHEKKMLPLINFSTANH